MHIPVTDLLAFWILLRLIIVIYEQLPASWPSGKVFISEVGSLRLKTWSSEIGQSVASGGDFSWKVAVMPGHNGGPTNSLPASAWCKEYKIKFWFSVLLKRSENA